MRNARMFCPVHSVVETPAYLASAADEGLSADERIEIVRFIAANPQAGTVVPGSGGARKVRFAGRSKGKSGGYRVITFFARADVPVFLLDVYGKGSKANLSKAELNELRLILTDLPQIYRQGVAIRARKRRSETT